ncbi:hypothetical protein [Paenibacillus sp. DS2015]|uniref:hypothetical protein n=1 Tax=Paenibacillus sp. DS2015 TaxID=3373917 RepID=UPI003D19581E
MPGSNKELKKTKTGSVAPQFFNPDTDDYEYAQGKDGASFVSIKKDAHETITLINALAVAGNGEYAAVTAKSITVEFYGSAVGTTATFSFYLVGLSGTKRVFAGIRKTVSIEQVTTAVVGDIVSFSVPAGYKLRIENTVAVGGTVTAKGTVE